VWDERLKPKEEEEVGETSRSGRDEEEEMDTDEEIEAVRKRQGANNGREIKREMADSEDAYDADTDVDEENSDDDLPPLPDFFVDKGHFFLDKELSQVDQREMRRLVVAAGGRVDKYMSRDVRFVLADGDEWRAEFDDALRDNGKLTFLRLAYVRQCWRRKTCLPTNGFSIKR